MRGKARRRVIAGYCEELQRSQAPSSACPALRSGVTQRVLQGHTAGTLGLAIHRPTDGKSIEVFSAANDGTVRRWAIAPLPHQRLVDRRQRGVTPGRTRRLPIP